MSTTYSDLTETNFPDSLDTMTRVSDLNYANKALADQYYTYLNAGNFSAAQQLLTDNPTLATMIINAAKINKYQDIAIALERFFKNDVEGYLETRFAYIGTYASGTTYVKGNIVDFGGEGFICRVESSVGVSPTAHITTTNWAIIAAQGIQGATGTGLAPRGNWNSSTSYYVNDCVANNNALWQCLATNSSSEPTSNNSDWLSLLNLNVSWNNLTDKPTSFTPTEHTHDPSTDLSSLVPVIKGGTGASTADTARANFGACSAPVKVVVTLPSTGWVKNSTTTCYEQTVSAPGILATDTQATVRIEPVGSTDQAAQLLTDEAYGAVFTAGGYAACNTNGQLYCRGPAGGAAPAVNFQIAVCMAR